MSKESTVTVRMFGVLHTLRKGSGLASIAEVLVPAEGRRARDIARELDLPLDKIEGVFVNAIVYDIDHLILPGDRVAFVPTGVPGPHRFMLGVHRAGQARGNED
ncbi:MAG TPA: MoaD/ThiS family protein [Desulfuromonadales bacterium]|nr:MoaD/ThiS family protein [Desulfuromonadales bacterium]